MQQCKWICFMDYYTTDSFRRGANFVISIVIKLKKKLNFVTLRGAELWVPWDGLVPALRTTIYFTLFVVQFVYIM
jgi:hypothetical protein